MKVPAAIIAKLAELIQQGQFTELETESIEIKPVPATGADWKEIQKSVNAFLNSRGGILILGVREEGTGPSRRYVLDGWKDHAEPNLKEFPRLFTDRKGVKQDLGDCFPHMEILPILGGRVAVREVADMSAAVRTAFAAASPGATVVLAPACASFDMFHDYAERGRIFKDEVAKLRTQN